MNTEYGIDFRSVRRQKPYHDLMRAVLFLSALLLSIHVTLAQEEYGVPKLEDLVKIPPSPEAQAFAKYGNTQVNLHSGTPDISIPLYTVQGREFSVPITLTYDASGIKVDQMATWAGLGWHLTVGGMITRQVRGKPDDFLTSNPVYRPFYAPTLWSDYSFVRDFSGSGTGADFVRYYSFVQKSLKTIDNGNDMEIQPDVYSISAPGLSGTLYINYQTMIAYSMDHPEWKVEFIEATGDVPENRIIGEWRITDESGNLFVFDMPEVTYVDENNSYGGYYSYNSAWCLTRIETKNKRDLIQFYYGAGEWIQPRIAGASAYRLDYRSNNTDCGSDKLEVPALEPTYRIIQLELSEIVLNGQTILSIDTKSRMDIVGKGALDAIRVIGLDGSFIKKFKFIHSYFGTPSTDEDASRLRLDRLEIFGSDTSAAPQQYQFQYFQYFNQNDGFPSRKSFSQDYWGYYNGANNTTLIPYVYEYDGPNLINFDWQGGDRRPNFSAARTGTLQAIQYPTGGKTVFEYEPHKTVDIAWRAEYPTYITNFGGVGGMQPNNLFNYTDDLAGPSPGFPMGQSGGFNIPATGNYELKVNTTTAPELYVPGWAFAIIYRTGDIDCDANGNCNYGDYQDFDQLKTTVMQWADAEWFFYGGTGFASKATIPIHLEAGAYRFLFLNCDSHSSMLVEITSLVTIESHEVGGLRVKSITDHDEAGLAVSKRLFYYGDLSLVPNESVDEALSNSGEMNTGQLHLFPTFHKDMRAERFHPWQNGIPDLLECWTATRFSSNRANADQSVTYPVVTEVQVDDEGTNGFVVTDFITGVAVSQEGYMKGSPLNGRPSRKRTYNSASQIVSEESTFYSVKVADVTGTGEVVGFYFYHVNNNKVDLYVKTALYTPFNTFTEYKTAKTSFNAGAESPAGSPGNYNEMSCWDSGRVMVFFDNKDDADDARDIAASQGLNPSNTAKSDNPCCIWYFTYQTHTVHDCFSLGGEVLASSYLFPRRWATTDSTRTVQYFPEGQLVTVRKSFYENNNHYQVTRVEQKDSKGTLHKIEIKYPHEMQASEPSNSVWPSLVNAHRINEKIQVTATYGSGSPDFKQKTTYKAVTGGSNTMYLPDTIKISSGTGPLEARIRYHQYDAIGNPLELSRINDVNAVYLWGYNDSYTVATITNAKANEVFFNSFEYDPDVGNTADAHTGTKGKTGGYSKTLTGLTANKPYVLTYWQKTESGWEPQTVSIAASGSTEYSISISGHVDDVRFYPLGAAMTTYTYKPLIGVETATDPNNLVTKYTYDSFGRLNTIRDHLGNILRQVTYHYRAGAAP